MRTLSWGESKSVDNLALPKRQTIRSFAIRLLDTSRQVMVMGPWKA